MRVQSEPLNAKRVQIKKDEKRGEIETRIRTECLGKREKSTVVCELNKRRSDSFTAMNLYSFTDQSLHRFNNYGGHYEFPSP